MIERIDLFMPPRSRYEVLHHFTRTFAKALSRSGVNCRVLEAEKHQPQKFVDTLLEDKPECTLSFNGLLPDDQGRFFCDLIHVPHIACLVDSPQHFLTLTQSPLSIVTCVDRFCCEFFEGLNFHNVLFMPHGVDKDWIAPRSPLEKTEFDVVMLASFTDFHAIENEWKGRYDKTIYDTLLLAAEIALTDRELSSVQALAKALDIKLKDSNAIDSNTLDFLNVLDQLEDYINGKDRVALIHAIKDAKVHIFGATASEWKREMKGRKNVTVHDQIPYVEAFEVMRKSKIVLNSCQKIKYGAHERIFAGIASGAAVLTNENAYMHDNFKHRENILFYRHGNWKEANGSINEYLRDDQKRNTLVQKAQEVVKEGHTWDHRAATLLSEAGPILRRIVDCS